MEVKYKSILLIIKNEDKYAKRRKCKKFYKNYSGVIEINFALKK